MNHENGIDEGHYDQFLVIKIKSNYTIYKIILHYKIIWK